MRRVALVLFASLGLLLGLAAPAPAAVTETEVARKCKTVILDRIFWIDHRVCVDVKYRDTGLKVKPIALRVRVTTADGTYAIKNLVYYGAGKWIVGSATENKWKRVAIPWSKDRTVTVTGSVVFPWWADARIDHDLRLR